MMKTKQLNKIQLKFLQKKIISVKNIKSLVNYKDKKNKNITKLSDDESYIDIKSQSSSEGSDLS